MSKNLFRRACAHLLALTLAAGNVLAGDTPDPIDWGPWNVQGGVTPPPTPGGMSQTPSSFLDILCPVAMGRLGLLLPLIESDIFLNTTYYTPSQGSGDGADPTDTLPWFDDGEGQWGLGGGYGGSITYDVPPKPPPVPDLPPTQYFPAPGLQGTDWEWGVWKDQILDPQGVPLEVAHGLYVRELNGVTVPPNIADLVAGSTQFYLAGSGLSAAYVSHAGAASLVQGICALDVSIGGGPSTWAGEFRMDGPNAALHFDAMGTVQADGTLAASQWDLLQFDVNGAHYNTLSEYNSSFNGRVIGTGQSPNPISGAIGQFSLDHRADGPSAHGVFGADLHGP